MERKYLNPCSLLLVHLFLVAFGSCQSTVGALAVTGTKFVKDGPSMTGQFEQWEISYYAKDYIPICATSTEAEGADYWSNCPECDLAMQRFNSTPVQTGIYDEAGVARPASELGMGEKLCMCFGAKHRTGRYLDICLLVGMGLEVLQRPPSSSGWFGTPKYNVAVGIQAPELNSNKMLPNCAEISVTANPASLPSSTSTGGSGVAASSRTPISDSGTVATNISSPPGAAEEKKKGISTEAIIGIAVGLPGAIVALVTLIIMIRRRGNRVAQGFNGGYH